MTRDGGCAKSQMHQSEPNALGCRVVLHETPSQWQRSLLLGWYCARLCRA